MGQASFVDGLVRAFKRVSGYDEFVAAAPLPRTPKKRGSAR
jgi:hypothetical protein